MKKIIAAAMSICIVGGSLPAVYSCSPDSVIEANAWSPSDYCRYDNAELPYDNSSFVNSEFYVDPTDSEIKPTLKIDKLEVPVSAAGTKQRVALKISGADGKYDSASFHVNYDNRLTVSDDDLSFGKAVSEMYFCEHHVNSDTQIWFGTAAGDGYDGLYAYIDFTIPADAAPGDLYPIGIDYVINDYTNDEFTNMFDDDIGRLMQSALFTNGIENGYIKITEDSEPPKNDTEVYVSIHVPDEGYVISHEPVKVTDIDKDDKLTINDALYIAHYEHYKDGADGFGSKVGTYGLMLTKLWGIENGGNYGYLVNNEYASGLADPIKDGDSIRAFVYSDTKTFSDAYAYFNIENAEIMAGRAITLTANYLSYDASYNTVKNPLADADILINGEPADLLTNEEGKVTIKFNDPGTKVVTAVSSDRTLVPPVCVVEVKEADENVLLGDANCDTNIDMADVVIVTQACLNPKKYGVEGTSEDRITDQGVINGDIGSAYGLDITDALIIQKHVIGLDVLEFA